MGRQFGRTVKFLRVTYELNQMRIPVKWGTDSV